MTDKLSIGLMLPTTSSRSEGLNAENVGMVAEWAEARGFDALWAGDHIFHPLNFLESLVSLSVAAGRTRSIQIGTCVLLLPMRQLSIVASQISTLSILSGGRLHLGVGVGGEWPDEWTAAGVPLSERGARLNEALPLLRDLLAGKQVDFAGRFNHFPNVALSPAGPKIPLYLAGRAPAAIERVAQHGDGWIGFFLTANGFRRDLGKIREARERAGTADKAFKPGMLVSFTFDDRDDDADLRAALAINASFPPELQLTPPEVLRNFVIAGTPARVIERLQEYIDGGCELIALQPVGNAEKSQENREIFASEVLPKLKRI